MEHHVTYQAYQRTGDEVHCLKNFIRISYLHFLSCLPSHHIDTPTPCHPYCKSSTKYPPQNQLGVKFTPLQTEQKGFSMYRCPKHLYSVHQSLFKAICWWPTVTEHIKIIFSCGKISITYLVLSFLFSCRHNKQQSQKQAGCKVFSSKVSREDNNFHILFCVQHAPRPNREINSTIQNQVHQETHRDFTGDQTSCELFQSFKHIWRGNL